MGLLFNKYKSQEYGRLSGSEEQQRRQSVFVSSKTLCEGNLYIDEEHGLFYIHSPYGDTTTTIAKIQNVTSIHSDYVYDIGDDATTFDYGRIIFDLKDEEFPYIDYRIGVNKKFFNFNAKKEYEKLSRKSVDEVCSYFKVTEGKITKTHQ